MIVDLSCRWCHQFQPTGYRYCAFCGHQISELRITCDCPRCLHPEPVWQVLDTTSNPEKRRN